MTKKFYVWADANCNGENIEWRELTATEFILFVRNPKNRDRKIIKMGDPYLHEADEIYIEVTKEQFAEWDKEYKHTLYINRANRDLSLISLDYLQEISDTFDIPNPESNIEEVFGDEIDDLFSVIDELPEKQKKIAYIKYESIKTTKTIPQLCKEYEIAERTYYREISAVFVMIRDRFPRF